MINIMRKRIFYISAVLLFAFLITVSSSVTGFAEAHSEENYDIELLNFINIYNSSLTFYVSDYGMATVMYTVSGLADSGKIVVKTYVERKTLGVFWSKIELENGETEWTDVSTSAYTSSSHSVRVRENGTYRATMVIYVDGDSIKKTAEFEYKKSKTLGDVNFDGRVTAADARLILRCSALLEHFSSSQKSRADMSGDGKVSATDARIALRWAAGLKEE